MTHWPQDLDEREAEIESELCPLYEQCTTRHRPFMRSEQHYYHPCPGILCTYYASERQKGMAILDRLAVTGTLVAPPPIRRRYGRDLLGLIGVIITVLAGALLAYGLGG